jgi:GNAT superfamily N-acetyltransferase
MAFLQRVARRALEGERVLVLTAQHIEAWFAGRSPEIYRLALEQAHIWVAESEARILGFVSAEPGEVTLLFVLPEASGQGLGGRLFRRGLSVASAAFDGPLTVVATKNSEAFYRRYGFEPVEEQAFVRGSAELHYPVVRMLQRSRLLRSHATTKTDA